MKAHIPVHGDTSAVGCISCSDEFLSVAGPGCMDRILPGYRRVHIRHSQSPHEEGYYISVLLSKHLVSLSVAEDISKSGPFQVGVSKFTSIEFK